MRYLSGWPGTHNCLSGVNVSFMWKWFEASSAPAPGPGSVVTPHPGVSPARGLPAATSNDWRGGLPAQPIIAEASPALAHLLGPGEPREVRTSPNNVKTASSGSSMNHRMPNRMDLVRSYLQLYWVDQFPSCWWDCRPGQAGQDIISAAGLWSRTQRQKRFDQAGNQQDEPQGEGRKDKSSEHETVT